MLADTIGIFEQLALHLALVVHWVHWERGVEVGFFSQGLPGVSGTQATHAGRVHLSQALPHPLLRLPHF